MKRKQRILDLLKKNLKNFNIDIIDNSHVHSGHHKFDGKGETHLHITLKPKNNYIFNRLKIHRDINNLLSEEYTSGLHSLEIRII